MPALTNDLSFDALELVERLLKPETRNKMSAIRTRNVARLMDKPQKKRGRPRNALLIALRKV